MNKKYRIIKATRQIGDVFYLAQKRVLFLFWVTFTESVPVGFADFMEFEIRYKSCEDAENAICEDFRKSRHNKESREIILPNIERFYE